ncbi:MAG: peptidoglycan-binding domain-containing protein, partial [Candidatus Omnitrophica bacterium]|nr:peptidoglycan-binding domain-containing protein [Candidatus Omnitrophota bacterium]
KTIKGTVIDVSGSDVKIKLESPGTPQTGDAVDLSYLTAAGESLPAGTWRVAMVEGDIAYATVEESKSDPMIGLKAVITPSVPAAQDASGPVGPVAPAITGKDPSKPVEDKPTLIDPAKISQADVKAVQTALKKLGFDPGTVDGLLGKKTQAAIRRFQKSKGLKVDGMLSQALMDKLQSLSQNPAGSSKSNAASRR